MKTDTILLGAVAVGAVGYAIAEALARMVVYAEKVEDDQQRDAHLGATASERYGAQFTDHTRG